MQGSSKAYIGCPQKPRKLLKSLIVKIWMPYQKAERNDA
jgi:hypothetical protein